MTRAKKVKPKIPCQQPGCGRVMHVKRVHAHCVNGMCPLQYIDYRIEDLLESRLQDGYRYCDDCGAEISDCEPEYQHAGGNIIICQACENAEQEFQAKIKVEQ